MNADRLLANFERVADAPDAIPRLRRLILDLAVQGKLVKQDPNDEPAKELLKRIAAEKARLVEEGKIKKPKVLPAIEDSPYRLPNTWCWVPIREVTSDHGQCVPQTKFTYIDVTAIDKENGSVANPKVLQANQAPSRARKVVHRGDVVYSCVRPYLLNIAIIEDAFDPPPIASTAFAVLDGYGLVLPRFQWIVLRSPFMVMHVEEEMRGQAYPAINDTDFARLPFPLPPLAEQHRIVAKIDELMGLCEQMEAAQVEREATRERLAAASLARLNEPDPETFHDDARFALDALPALVKRPDQIQQLRRTILNLAVRGKLVEQDPNDEPAEELLRRIGVEKERLVKEKKISQQQVKFQALDLNEISFHLPNSWNWCPATYPCLIISDKGKKIKTKDVVETGKFPVVDQGKMLIRGYHNDANKVIRVKEPIVLFGDHTRETKLIDFDFIVGADGVKLLQPIYIHTPYYFLALQWLPLENRGYGRHFKLLKASFIPLPPLAEQHRIVAKVDELMGLCDELEENLANGEETRSRLLDAMLAEAIGT